MAQLTNMILDAMVTHLTTKMKDEISDEATKATIVKKGLLQIDKIQNAIQIGVTGGDHEDPNYEDGILTLGDQPEIGFNAWPAREIGGTQEWTRRFIARLEIYYIAHPYNEDDAHKHAYDVLGRLMANIENLELSILGEDDYGESIAIGHPWCYANTFFQTGGPPASYVFRGKIKWLVHTSRP